MIQDDYYSNNAQCCRTLAKRAHTQPGRDLFIELARRWDELIAEKEFQARLARLTANNAGTGQTKSQRLLVPEH